MKSTITHSKRTMGAALLATALVTPLAALSVPAAQAVDAKTATANSAAVSNASLTWKISDCAFTACGSLTQAQSVSGNVTKAADGFKFTGGTGTIDQLTGALSIAYTGSATIGNTNQGGFSVTLTDPVITVDAQGSGSLAADASFKTSPTATPTTANDVIVVSLPKVTPSTSFIVTPPWDGVGVPAVPAPVDGKQFAPSFMSVVPDALKGFFWATGTTGSNLT
ncbi:MAG: HtaA domain-containing protein, partial [Actinomycetota bacterium]|nr:HtaA domain-containing protein [Actinomycetota bacterium]